MGIPPRGLPHTVTRVRPATGTDAYGDTTYDYGAGATRTTGIRAWLQQDRRAETYEDGRTPDEQLWLMMTNDRDLDRHDQIEWPAESMTFAVEGEPEPTYTPAGFHHVEATLRILAG